MKKNLLLLFAVCLLALPAFATVVTVTVANYSFTPSSSVTLNINDTIKWVWSNGAHTTTSGTIPTGAATWNAPISSTSASYSYVPTVAGTYNYFCTPHQSLGMTGTFTVNCATLATPTASVVNNAATTACLASAPTLSSTTATGVTYQWKNGGVAVTGATASTFTPTTTGAYTVTTQNACSTTATSNAISVTINNPPATPVAATQNSAPTTICAGTAFPTLVNSVTSGVTYQWSNTSGPVSGATGATFTPTAAGTYMVSVTNTCGSATSNAIPIVVNPVPVAPVVSVQGGSSTTACADTPPTLITNPATGVTYQWKNAGVAISGATNATYLANATGTYTLTAINSCGTAASAVTSVTINPLPVPNFTVAHTGLAYTFTNTTPGANNYSWDFGDGTAASTQTSPTHTYAAAGTYTVSMMAMVNATSCMAFKNATVTAAATGINNLNGKDEITVSPNPAGAMLHIAMAHANTPATVTIIDITGRAVFTGAYGNPSAIDIATATYPSGMYFLRIVQGGAQYMQQIAVAH